jgi:hypothetical protein
MLANCSGGQAVCEAGSSVPTSVTTLASPGLPKYILSDHSDPWKRFCLVARRRCDIPSGLSPSSESGETA